MAKSSIEWTEATWNPIVGCSILTPGCTNCYAMKMAARIEAMNLEARASGKPHPTHYNGTTRQVNGTTRQVNGTAVWTGKIVLAGDNILLAPLRRKKPTIYFVNSMGDLFHEDCPDEWIDRVFAVMALCPQHTFQVLTKRAARMRDYMTHSAVEDVYALACRQDETLVGRWVWPLPNVWLGVSTERQQEADERIPELLRTSAAVRFISYEPALGPVNLQSTLGGTQWIGGQRGCGGMHRGDGSTGCPRELHHHHDERCGHGLDWVICGGESGPNARPMHPDWARSLRDQCAAAEAAFFFKQWGNWVPIIDRDHDDPDWRRDYSLARHQPDRYKILNLAGGCGFHGERVHLMQRYGKKAAGNLLDGVTHDAMPQLRRPVP